VADGTCEQVGDPVRDARGRPMLIRW
jgi:hypothetical protein